MPLTEQQLAELSRVVELERQQHAQAHRPSNATTSQSTYRRATGAIPQEIVTPSPAPVPPNADLVWKIVGILAMVIAAWVWLGGGMKSGGPERQHLAPPPPPAVAIPAPPIPRSEGLSAPANEEPASPAPAIEAAVAVELGQQRALTRPLVVKGVTFAAGSPLYVVGAKDDAVRVVIVSHGNEYEFVMSVPKVEELSR